MTSEPKCVASNPFNSTTYLPATSKQCPVKAMSAKTPARTLFMADGWRGELCRCADCAAGVYTADRGLEFLLDPEDTVHHYEAKGKQEQGQLKYSNY